MIVNYVRYLNILVESKTGIKFFTLLNDQVDAWTHLFKSIDNNFLYSNTELLQVDFNGNDVNFKTYNK
jgi:hypothetical protein